VPKIQREGKNLTMRTADHSYTPAHWRSGWLAAGMMQDRAACFVSRCSGRTRSHALRKRISVGLKRVVCSRKDSPPRRSPLGVRDRLACFCCCSPIPLHRKETPTRSQHRSSRTMNKRRFLEEVLLCTMRKVKRNGRRRVPLDVGVRETLAVLAYTPASIHALFPMGVTPRTRGVSVVKWRAHDWRNKPHVRWSVLSSL